MGINSLHRNDLTYCCQGSGHSAAVAEAPQGSRFQLRPIAASALFDLPGRGNSEKEKALILDRKQSLWEC